MNIENTYSKGDLADSHAEKLNKAQNIHHKAIFDALNEALDMERPYKYKGQPTPWSKQTRVVKSALTIP